MHVDDTRVSARIRHSAPHVLPLSDSKYSVLWLLARDQAWTEPDNRGLESVFLLVELEPII